MKIGRDRIEKDPDKRVQEALQLLFTKFANIVHNILTNPIYAGAPMHSGARRAG